MAPLSDHLRESGSHGRLPFHPDCPICRAERLSGRLAGEPMVGRRSQAALLATTLAVSGLASSSAALAQGGAHIPATQTPDGDLDRVDADDGTQPDTPTAEDDGPVGGENLLEPDPNDGQEGPAPTPPTELAPEQPGDETEPIVDPAPEPQPPAAPLANPAPAPAPGPAPVPTQPPPAPPTEPDATAPPAPVAALEEPGAAEAPPEVHHLRLQVSHAGSAAHPTGAAAPPTTPPTPTPRPTPAQPAVVASAQEAPPVTQPTRVSRTPVEGDRYIIRPGDSLWSIARRLLGADASVSRIAREVVRLWELNHERIGTRDPNLLPVGVEVRL